MLNSTERDQFTLESNRKVGFWFLKWVTPWHLQIYWWKNRIYLYFCLYYGILHMTACCIHRFNLKLPGHLQFLSSLVVFFFFSKLSIVRNMSNFGTGDINAFFYFKLRDQRNGNFSRRKHALDAPACYRTAPMLVGNVVGCYCARDH